MKRKTGIVVVLSVAVLAVGGVWFAQWKRDADLPRISLEGGGEFRVFKICYGSEEVHQLGGAPPQMHWLWNRLPRSMQRIIPPPPRGDTAVVPGDGHVALSIYWGWIFPGTGEPETGPSGDVIVTTDSGAVTILPWPDPFDDEKGRGYRQIIMHDLPHDSRKLHFRVPVNDEPVEFTIDNPAFGK